MPITKNLAADRTGKDAQVEDQGQTALIKTGIEGAKLNIPAAMGGKGLFARVRCLATETDKRIFCNFRRCYKALSGGFAKKIPSDKVNGDGI